MKVARIVLVLAFAALYANAQPLRDPYYFSMTDDIDVDTSLVVGPIDPAGSHGRVVSKDGHLAFEDGVRFRPVGVTVQVGACFPDSVQAVLIAKRMRALGITCVRFANFDYTFARTVSILADGPTTLGNGLDAESMARFDFFVHQLRQRGIYYVFTFHGYWNPRPEDGVPDSTGWAARIPLTFEPKVQQIHRGIIRLLLEHVNPHTGVAYKNDPALAYMIAAEDASPFIYWMYTKDVVRSNQYGNINMGLNHHRIIDSMFCARLKAKGLNTDAKINAQWRTQPEDPTDKIRNGGFEDPFDPSWTLGVNTTAGAQAIMQYPDNDKVEGAQSGRVRIGSLGSSANNGSIYLYQVMPNLKRLHRYTLSLWMKTETGASRRVQFILHNPVYPYNSYGLVTEQTINQNWTKYDYTFTCQATEETSAALQIQMGSEATDVYFDGITLKEVGFEGLRPGESVMNNTIVRDQIWSNAISPNRIAEQTQFYADELGKMFSAVRKLVRDTLKSELLMCPSLRTFSAIEIQAAKDYDLFTSTDYRGNRVSVLSEDAGGPLYAHTQYDISNKPFVLSLSAIQYPRPYQPETAVTLPAYAGLHDWDGVFFSVFNSQPRAGNFRADSTSYWEIFDKPAVLTMLPAVSNALRSFEVKPSTKVLQIKNNDEMYKYPLWHVPNPYSLSLGVDGRMPLFRRIEIIADLDTQETLLPQLEISALSGMVDPTALDAENEQIFFDATRGLLRVITPKYLAFSGTMEGQILTEEGVIVEQTSPGSYTSVVMSSLTSEPIAQSTRNLLVVASRGLNEGAVYDGENLDLAIWGQGPMQLEARAVRVTLSAPTFDSCFVQPLGNDARPKGQRRSFVRSPTGRFSIDVNTKTDQAPWYEVTFSRVNTSVDEESNASITLAPNPVADHFTVLGTDVTRITITDLLGNIVYKGEDAVVNTSALAPGAYNVEVFANGVTTSRMINVMR